MDTSARLLAEAELLVRRRGYAGFSYADLSEAVGVRKASIHHHFPTKETLGLALVAAYDARYDAAMAGVLAGEAHALRRVEAYARFYLTGLEQEAGCLCAALAVEMDVLPPAFRDALSAFFRKHLAWLELVLADGRARGEVRAEMAPAAGARMILSTLEGALLMERVLGGTDGFRATITALRAALCPAIDF